MAYSGNNIRLWVATPSWAADLTDHITSITHGETQTGGVRTHYQKNYEESLPLRERLTISFDMIRGDNSLPMDLFVQNGTQPMVGWAWHGERNEWGQFAPDSHGINAPRDISTNTISWQQSGEAWRGTSFTPFTINATNTQETLAKPITSGQAYLVVVTANTGNDAKTLRVANGQNVGQWTAGQTGWKTRAGNDRAGSAITTTTPLSGNNSISGFFMSGTKVTI